MNLERSALSTQMALVVLESLVEELAHVCKCPSHHSRMDEVELLGKCPIFVEIIDLEAYIWWETALNQTYFVVVIRATYNDG